MTPMEEYRRAVLMATIAKLEDGLNRPFEEAASGAVGPVPLSIEERILTAETLRRACFTTKEWKTYRKQQDLKQYEAIKKIAYHGVRRGQREAWIQGFYGKSKATLIRYFTRKRAR
jgi:hypothetical protein